MHGHYRHGNGQFESFRALTAGNGIGGGASGMLMAFIGRLLDKADHSPNSVLGLM
jgi:hypothetical protein